MNTSYFQWIELKGKHENAKTFVPMNQLSVVVVTYHDSSAVSTK